MDTRWKPEYEVGHPRIDSEHQVFLDLIEQFTSEAARGVDAKRLSRHCAELYKYADFHFFSEEGLLESVGYNDLEGHKRLHADLLKSLRIFIESISIDSIMADEMAEFLLGWFVNHTTAEDPKHIHFLPKTSPYNR
ncbi:bacteriohemerythrin [Paramagnetospirillum marisnigri]|uniref:bacteriohemerythrin n=1 Tax=Paramagnetospirillum marisnigri TaxID=1285242 RepID=UPI0015612783|nr:hemerythrin domain-containing protein [Paramagnetospirillum marisnigri]